jgi:hypothetical protein
VREEKARQRFVADELAVEGVVDAEQGERSEQELVGVEEGGERREEEQRPPRRGGISGGGL